MPHVPDLREGTFVSRLLLTMKAALALFTLGVFCLRASATSQVFESGPDQVSLLELYTSEGCSSCPPAETWLSRLESDPRLWKSFVPVAFHVDYWDNLGWPDRFASREFTQRQYAIANTWRARSVYTPCFVRDGREWRSRDLNSTSQEPVGVLRIQVREDGHLLVNFAPTDARSEGAFSVTLALLGSEIKSNVRSGENAGRQLRHDFVALSLDEQNLERTEDDTWHADFAPPPAGSLVATPWAVAAWITRPGNLEPLQAVGGWLSDASN